MAVVNDAFMSGGGGSPPKSKFSYPPTELVLKFRKQGLSADQTIQMLQREGYEIDQIHDAINQADIKEGVEIAPLVRQGDKMPEQMGGMPPPPPGGQQYDESAYPSEGDAWPQQQGAFAAPAGDEERINEIAEAIIEEKWSALIDNVTKILEWKEATESKITKIEQQMTDLKDNFDKLHEGILERVGEYDKNINSVGIELKALEKVFREILPGFMENVSELSRITQSMKKMKPVKK